MKSPRSDVSDNPPVDWQTKAMTLLQFARKAGKLIHGTEAVKKSLEQGNLRLVILSGDVAKNTKDKINNKIREVFTKPEIRQFSSSEELSLALGLPFTCVMGIADKNFAAKILEYLSN